MTIGKWIFTGLYCFTIASSSFAQNLFEYKLRRFDTTNQVERCNSKIKSLATQFASTTGVTIISASCRFQDVDEKYLTAVIGYSSPSVVEVSTVMSPYGDGVNDFAIYDTIEKCEADKERQFTFFKQATGLEPFTSYCYVDSNISRAKYGLQIDAIGKTEVKQFIGGLEMYSDIAPSENNFFQHIANRMTGLGVTVSDVRIGRAAAWNQIRINYYAKERLNIDVNFAIKFESADACKMELSRINSSFMDASPHIIASYCEVGNGLNGNRLGIATAITYEENISSIYQFHMLDSNYPSRAACEGDLNRVKDLLTSQGMNVIAVVCGLNQRQFAAHAFLKK